MVQQQPSLPMSGEITGWFGRTRTRLFGQRDPVEAQLRDIARQGAFGAMVSHFVATLLLILFSFASLIALGADSLQAVLVGLHHNFLDIPNAVATGVTLLLVPAMDWGMLRAASKIRLLMTRRAEGKELALQIFVVVCVSAIETSTYCYMAGRYEHPGVWVAWVLIVARATAAPLLGVYLATDRAHPVTSRDILAQVELGAGAGVIRDVTIIANDPTAPLARKMELFGASAVMGEHEEDKLNRLIAVAQKSLPPALPAGHSGVPSVKIHAAATLPLTETLEHHIAAASAYKAMHDPETTGPMIPSDPWATYDETNGYEDDDPGITGVYSEDELAEPLGTSTSNPRHTTRHTANSGPHIKTKTRGEAISDGMKRSHKERKAEGRERRQRIVKADVNTVLNEWYASGATRKLTDAQLAKKVFDLGNVRVKPSENNVSRYRGEWLAESKRNAHEADIEPMEPQELRELQEVW